MLGHELLIVLKLAAHPLKSLLVVLNVGCHCFVVVHLKLELVSLFLHLTHCFVSQLELVGQVIDVPFKGFDLSDVVLLLLL